MKHRIAGRRLDRTTEHRTAMFRNMVTSLLRHERIVTTTPKAKELKRIADKTITLGKRGTPHARRIAFRDIRDTEVLEKLFGPLAERYASRAGGYTRLVRVERRHGDNADMAVIELMDSRAGGYTRLVRVERRHGDNADMAVIELMDRAPAADEKEPEKSAKKPEKKAEKKAAPAEKKAEKAPKKATKIDKTAPATEKAPKGKAKKAQRGQ
jgi:large subunit ribosomal protein L17